MVLAFAGRRAQSIAGDLEPVSLRIRRVLAALRPGAVIGALADGADLLVVEAALQLVGTAVHVVLPTREEVFREQSVADDWRSRFDRALAEVRRRNTGSVRSLDLPDGSDAYRKANVAFLDEAQGIARDGERVAVLAIAAVAQGAMVQDLVAGAQLRSIPALRIDPGVVIADRPRVFVAMPYGERKLDPQRRIEVNCDLVYQRILLPALENAQLNYRRADEEIDSGVVLEPMIEWLAEADLVIGDLQTANFNVGWELGLRHLMKARQTLLIRPAGTTAPFDLNMLRHVVYVQDERGLSDDAVHDAWTRLAPYLRAVGGSSGASDSPVDAVMDVEQWSRVKRRPARSPRWEEARQRLALARDLADGDLMLAVVRDAADLDNDELLPLRAEAGVGLVRLGRYQSARALLSEVVAADGDVRRPDAYVYYAQALYRPRDADVASYDEAERILRQVILKRPTHPEVRAMLGAVAKRRASRRVGDEERRGDLLLAMESYRLDYERNLNAHYEGINVVAIGVVLALRYDDLLARDLVRQLLPAVRVAAGVARESNPRDYWAFATLAECALHELLMGERGRPASRDQRADALRPVGGDLEIAAAYRQAGALRPTDGDLDSTLSQLGFLAVLGISPEPLSTARDALLAGAGRIARELA